MSRKALKINGRFRRNAAHQRRAEAVAGVFGRHEKDREAAARRRTHGASPSPTTNRLDASARVAMRCGSTAIAAPAGIATPARPARAAHGSEECT